MVSQPQLEPEKRQAPGQRRMKDSCQMMQHALQLRYAAASGPEQRRQGHTKSLDNAERIAKV